MHGQCMVLSELHLSLEDSSRTILQIPNQLFYPTDMTGFSTFLKIFDLGVMVEPRM